MTGDPVRDAWDALGCPAPAADLTTAGQCARCGTAGPAAPWRKVVSDGFGDWDRLPWRGSGMFCGACAWGLGHKPLRIAAHVIAPGSVTAPPALRSVLSSAVPPGMLVSVPVAGKKHIVPWAPYGVVVTDHEQLPWTAADASRLETLAALRGAGFGEAALGEPAPRWMVLRKLGPAARADVMAAWPRLAPWRARPSYLAVACRATRKPKDKEDPDGG